MLDRYSKSMMPPDVFWHGIKNRIINGNFDIWQRATSLNNGSGARYSADRWANDSSGSTYSISHQAVNTYGDLPGESTNFHRTVTSSVVGSSNYANLYQKVEFVRTLAGKTVTLSFYAKADSARNIAIEFSQYFGASGSALVTGIGVNQFSLTASWQKFTATVQIPSIAGKTVNGGGDYLALIFWFDAGSNYNSRTSSLGQQSGTFDIARVQLEAGDQATDFEERPYFVEYNYCLRYYELTTDSIIRTGFSGTFYSQGYNFKVIKRVAPSCTWVNGSISEASPSISLVNISTLGYSTNHNLTSTSTGAISGYVAADAEL